MSKQPEALRLADALACQVEIGGGDLDELEQAAAELRRLHALNGELLEAVMRARHWLQGSEPRRAQYLGEVIAKAGEQP